MPERTRANGGQLKVVLVTGPSGAGRSTTIHTLEDLGFEAIDNLPLSLLPRLLSGPPLGRNIALGVDVRNRDFSADALIDVVNIISADTGFDCTLVYLDCENDVLLRRFSETRRRHPLAPDASPIDGILRERDLLGGLRQRADIMIDTSEMSPHDLKAEITTWFDTESDLGLAVSLQSFSYKRGMPRGLDMVIDCRFLRNPHWDPDLRALDGRDPAVADHVKADPRFAGFFTKLTEMVADLLPAYREEGKAHFTLAFGCTGGQHRSVFVAEAMANALAEKIGACLFATANWNGAQAARPLGNRVSRV